MVAITDYKQCTSQEGKEFFALTIQGDVTVNQSGSGSFYLTANKASIPTSFNETVCQTLIGKTLAGSVQKVPCEAYVYVNQSGETVTVNHRYQYSPKEESTAVRQELNPVEVQQHSIPFLPLAGNNMVAAAA